jgi:IS5 family transposase
MPQAEKDIVKGGGVPEEWKPARTRQIDREGRWTLKRGKKKPVPPGGAARAPAPEIAVPMFGCKNHVGIDREHGFVRRFKVTDAAAHDGAQLGAVLDPGNTASPVWADTAYRSAANVEMLQKRGLKPQFQRPKPRGKPMPRHVARGNAKRARIRSRVEHVFAAQKCRFALMIRTVGKARATAKLALANLAYNFTRFLWLETRQAA